MKRLLHFFSLAVMTQMILMLSQLILLPVQVRLWGQEAAAHWYSALALATVTYVVDLGLRTAGHAELMKAHADPFRFPAETAQFRQIWSWIRVLILTVTVILVLGDLLFFSLSGSGNYPAWRSVLIIACALETILIIRITYLDSLGRYRGAEASYFCFAVLRLLFSLPGLLLFHWTARELAWINLFAAALALFGQGYWLCRSSSLLQLSAGFPKLSWSVLALARHTVAEPLANWARLSLPVLVIARIAPPVAVTTYVALRAVFGAGRTTVQQLARVASVEVVKAQMSNTTGRAYSLLTVFLITAIFFGSSVGFFVVIDNMRLLGLWLKHFDRLLFQQITLSFALTAPFFSYQIPMNVMFRNGLLASVARRHYSFVVFSAVFAGISVFIQALPVYLAFLVLAEIILSISFFMPDEHVHSAFEGLRIAAYSSLAIFFLWFIAYQNILNSFLDFSFQALLASALLLLTAVLCMALVLYFGFGCHIQALRRSSLPDTSLVTAD